MEASTELAKQKIEDINYQISRLDEDIFDTYELFSKLENEVLKSAVLVNYEYYVNLYDNVDIGKVNYGSGFFIKASASYYYIMTNNHVIDTSDIIVSQKLYVFDYDMNKYQATVVCQDSSYDMAILRIKRDNKKTYLKPMSLAKNNPVADETVFTVGNPNGQMNCIGIGSINRYRTNNYSDKTSNVKYLLIEHNAYMDHGNSGGMLINQRLEVIGINTFGSLISYEEHIGLASPIEKIKEFMNIYLFVL